MMQKTVLLVTAILFTALLAGVAVANDGSNDEFEDNGEYADMEVGDAEIDEYVDVREDDGTLTVSGVYMASDAGYRLVAEDVTLEDGTVRAAFAIERMDGMAAQVLTPVEFEDSLELEHGSYDLETTVTVDNETVHEESGSVSVGEPEEVTSPDEHDLDVGEYDLEQGLDEQDDGAELTYDGVYMAPDAGYSIVEERIDVDGNTVDVVFAIERSDGMAAQVLTPLEFGASQFLTPGEYDVNVALVVDEETIHEETDNISVGDEHEESGSGGFWWFILALLGMT